MLISVLICAFVSYCYKIGPIFLFKPEIARKQFEEANESNIFLLFYTPTHLNLGTYFAGVLLGFYYFEFKKVLHKHKRTLVSIEFEIFATTSG
jgi:hypothetical protein